MTAVPHITDPSAPVPGELLEKYLSRIDGISAPHWVARDTTTIRDSGLGHLLTLGDLRHAAAALRERAETIAALRAELAAERARFDFALDDSNYLCRWPEGSGAEHRWSAAAGDDAASTDDDPRRAIDKAMKLA